MTSPSVKVSPQSDRWKPTFLAAEVRMKIALLVIALLTATVTENLTAQMPTLAGAPRGIELQISVEVDSTLGFLEHQVGDVIGKTDALFWHLADAIETEFAKHDFPSTDKPTTNPQHYDNVADSRAVVFPYLKHRVTVIDTGHQSGQPLGVAYTYDIELVEFVNPFPDRNEGTYGGYVVSWQSSRSFGVSTIADLKEVLADLAEEKSREYINAWHADNPR